MTALPVSIGVVGLGYWGPNIARTLDALSEARLCWLCDSSASVRAELRARYPHARVTADVEDLLDDKGLEAIVVATPSSTHAEIARRALEAGKHVFVEKPLAHDGEEASRLAAIAAAGRRQLMVGHVLLFHPAITKLKELIETRALGDVYYLYANRQNLGRIRSDENALWSLGAHDLSVLLYLLDEVPVEVSAHGRAYLRPGIPDVVFCFLRYESGITAHLHLSWLDPHKFRRLTIVGSEQMAVFDDMESERKLTVYESSAAPPPTDAYGEYLQARFGDIVSPRIVSAEPLRLELEYFLSAARDPALPVWTEGSVAVVRLLEALQASLDRSGATTSVGDRRRWAPARVVSLVP